MDEAKQKAIRRLCPNLEIRLVPRHLESLLHQDAGGFLTSREMQEVIAEEEDYKQARKLLHILLEKNNEAFLIFCNILDGPDINQGVWAVRLMEEAGMSEFDSHNWKYCMVGSTFTGPRNCHWQCHLQYFCTLTLSTEFSSKGYNSQLTEENEGLDVGRSSASPPADELLSSCSLVSRHVKVVTKLQDVVKRFVSTLRKITKELKGEFEEFKVGLSSRLQLGYIPNGPSVDKVDKAECLAQLFTLFNVSANWVDLDVLEQLIEYSECETARAHLEDYKEFLTQHITDCFAALVSPMVDGTEPQPDGTSAKVQFVFSDELEQQRLSELLTFKKRLMQQFGIRKEEIEFVSACLGGSLITTWLVTLFIGWVIWYKLRNPTVLSFLQTEGVVEVRFACRNTILKKAIQDYRQEVDGGESDQLSKADEEDPLYECLRHEGETLDLFCANPFCNMPICCKCAEESHTTHTTVPLAQVDEERLAGVIKGHMDTMTTNSEYIRRVASEERKWTEQIARDESKAKSNVNMWVEEMTRAIRERGEALNKEIEKTATERRLLSQRKMVDADLQLRLEDAKTLGEMLIRQEVTKAELLNSASSISSQLIKMNAMCAVRKTAAVSAPVGFAHDEKEVFKSTISSSGCVTAGPHPTNTKVNVHFPCRMLYRPGMELILKVTVYDQYNRCCTSGGDCVTGYLHPLVAPGPPIKARVKNNYDGTYTVLFSNLYLGECKVVIMVNGQAISKELARLRIIEEDSTHTHETASELHFPDRPSFLRGIAISKDGVVCVSDREKHTIHIFDADLKHAGCIRNKGDKEGQLKCPRNLAFSKDGELVVTCTDRIDVLTLDGQFVQRFAFEGDGKVSDACDIAVRSNGQIYVADYGNDRIAVYKEDGSFLHSIGEQGTGPGQLTGPKGVAFYKDEKLVVSDHGNNRLQVFTPEGDYVTGFGSYGVGEGQFNHPLSLSVTDEGYVLVPEYNNNRISVHTLTGKPLLTWNGGESPRGPFNRPTAIAIRDKRECFVVETTGVHVLPLPEISDQPIVPPSH